MGSKRQRSWYDGSGDCCGCGQTFLPTGEEEKCPRCTQNPSVRVRRRQRQMLLEFILSRTEDHETGNSNFTYGSLLWYMKQFNELTRERNVTGVNSTRSQAFLTSQYGYKLCVQLDVFDNVLEDRQDIFMRPVILKGPNDGANAWPFKEKIIFKIINQIDHQTVKVLTYQPHPISNCFKKPTSEMNVASAGIAFPDVDRLYNQGFVKDGTLTILCKCRTSDLPVQTQEVLPLSCEVYEPSE